MTEIVSLRQKTVGGCRANSSQYKHQEFMQWSYMFWHLQFSVSGFADLSDSLYFACFCIGHDLADLPFLIDRIAHISIIGEKQTGRIA